jgi:glutamine synthetase
MATSTNDGASAPAPAVVPPGDSEMLAGTPSFDVISNYKGWIASKEYRDASAEIAKRMEDEGVEGVYFVCPSLDGRPVGKFVATNSFEGIANKGMNLHPMALTDFRADIFGNPIGFVEEDREGVMVPDLSTFRVFPWQPKLARVFCFYYDGESGDMRGIDARGTLARHEHTFKEEVGADMFVGIEPELMWLRRKDDGELEHTVNPLAFYEIAFIEEWEPLLLDLIEYGRGMGVTVTHADSEDKSQIELNQQPMSPLAYVDNFYTYRQLCRIVARKHGMIATFMPKPFMGVSANGHHHSLSIMNEAGENLLSGDMKGDCRLSEDGVHLLGGLIEHADAATLIGAPTANSYKRFWDVGLWAPFPQLLRVRQQGLPVPRPPHPHDRGSRHRCLLQPVPDRVGVPGHRPRRNPQQDRPRGSRAGERHARPDDSPGGAHPDHPDRGNRGLPGRRPDEGDLPEGDVRHVRRAQDRRPPAILVPRVRMGARLLPRALALGREKMRV